jgi:hypothetical protein
VAGRPQSWTCEGERTGPHRGLSAGHVATGVARARGSATGRRARGPAWGSGGATALAWSGRCDPTTRPHGTPHTPSSRHGSGARATRAGPRAGPGGRRRGASDRGRWGSAAHAPHGRAGDAGPPAALDRPTGAPVRAPTVTPPRPRRAAPAARDPERVLTTLAPRLDADGRHAASRQPRRSSAAGRDGVTAQLSAEPLDHHRRAWHARRPRGRDQAAPVARVWRAQDAGGQGPLGTPAVADTRVPRAGAMVLDAIAAPDCHAGADGFRPGRSPHAARHEVRERCRPEGRGGSVEADVRGDVDRLARTRRPAGRRQRVHDGRIRRLLGPWRRAGGRADGVRSHPARGVVPGGVMAPVLATIVRPQVLDAWCARAVRPRRQGRCVRTRVADAVVSGGERAADARRIMAVLSTRCARDGGPSQPSKTTVLACRQPATPHGAAPGHSTCAGRGWPHDGTTSRRGAWGSTRRTARTRRRRPQQAWWRWWRATRPAPRQAHSRMRCLKRRGPCPSDGLRGHVRWRDDVRRDAAQAWRDGRSRRRRTRARGWATCPRLLPTEVLPTPTLVHTIGSVRPGRPVMRRRGAETLGTDEPSACIAHVRDCGGAGWATTGSTRKPTPSSVRYAPAFRRGSPPALACHRLRE